MVRVGYDIHVINIIIEFVRYKNVHEIVLIYFERIYSRQFARITFLQNGTF